jgi:hypothetical protein
VDRILARRTQFVKRNEDKEKKELAVVAAMKKASEDKSKENSNQQKFVHTQ